VQNHLFDFSTVLHRLEPSGIRPISPEDGDGPAKVVILVSIVWAFSLKVE
jgi:hypothetical protein